MENKNADEIRKAVRDRYGELARMQAPSCCGSPTDAASCCCDVTSAQLGAARHHYSEEELDALSVDVASLGCGNPTALSELKENEVVLDLGSGGGLDCFLAARRVGPGGRVIGLDMTPEMVQLARANAGKLSLENVEFRLGEMERMPVESESVDVVISNCVINLSTDKDAVFREAFRVLKPGGRLCVSDMVTHGGLPRQVREDLELWACCVAGALDEEEYLGKMHDAGFTQVDVQDAKVVWSAQRSCCEVEDPAHAILASVTVTARKPA